MKKNNTTYIIASLHLMFLASLQSCSDDESNGLQLNEDAVNILVSPTSISTFDTNPTFEISTKSNSNQILNSTTIFLEDFTLEDGERTRNISQLQEIATADFNGSSTTEVTIPATTLKLEEVDDISYLHLQSNGASTPSTSIREIGVFEPTSADITSNLLEAQTTIEDTLNYSITTRGAVVDEVVIEQKLFFDGTYSQIISGNASGWPKDKGSYRFTSEDYNVNDTIYFRVTANSQGLMSASDEIKVFIDTQRINGISGDFELNKDVAQYNLEQASIVESPELIFVPETQTLEVPSESRLEFVMVPEDEAAMLFTELDLLKANTIFEAGTKISTIVPQAGSVYVYMITRTDSEENEVSSTGLLKINTLITLNTDNEISLTISYAEEVVKDSM